MQFLRSKKNEGQNSNQLFAPPGRGGDDGFTVHASKGFGNAPGGGGFAKPQASLSDEVERLNGLIAAKKAEAEALPMASPQRRELTKEIGTLKGMLTGVKLNMDVRSEAAAKPGSTLKAKLDVALNRGSEDRRLVEEIEDLRAENIRLQRELDQRSSVKFVIDDPANESGERQRSVYRSSEYTDGEASIVIDGKSYSVFGCFNKASGKHIDDPRVLADGKPDPKDKRWDIVKVSQDGEEVEHARDKVEEIVAPHGKAAKGNPRSAQTKWRVNTII
eukprot:gnl/MRDRNA2_/MRDRNA2_86456_c0_seq12.p1 gnl/MRDRNA2_/MRDRNA2_86456_c0~~gnl/MRDRNA2_/MRDRNA2_86456_c0_seq12.p1  ORF type:complete len:275 (+),score=63.37 gnl/MRDRNA2_/MRDRNA2_86456_c0_seq12:95-919(+)